MGRSTGVQVNAVTKSGSNQLSGLFRGNFRDSKFNAENPVLHLVEPIENQQLSTALGGPILKDRLHYFAQLRIRARAEDQHLQHAVPGVQHRAERHEQPEERRRASRLSAVVADAGDGQVLQGGALASRSSPATSRAIRRRPGRIANTTTKFLVQFTQVLSNRARERDQSAGRRCSVSNENLTTWSNHWQKANGITTGSPRITFTGFAIGGNQNYPRHQDQWVWNVRDDFTYSYNARRPSRPEARRGVPAPPPDSGELPAVHGHGRTPRTGPRPANLEALFPDAFNADTWNLAAISPLVRTYSIGVGDFNVHLYSKKIASWAQDDWQIIEQPDAESRACDTTWSWARLPTTSASRRSRRPGVPTTRPTSSRGSALPTR